MAAQKKLENGFRVVALRLQEMATKLSQSDIRTRISDALRDAYPKSGDSYYYCYLVDVFGDDKSGECVYSCNGDLTKAPYTITSKDGKSFCAIDTGSAVDVVPFTTYEEETDALNVGEAGARHSKRDMAQLQTIHDHSVTLGAACSAKEAEKPEAAPIDLIGDAVPLREGAVGQDGTALLKLIAPGKGSSGYYPAEVLERDGPKIFKKGTKNFWNHQTDAEESARPEGDLRDLASVLTEDARYEKDGPAGAGLYAKAKVFEQFRQPVDDLAKHIGMSIRATGKAKEGKLPDGSTGVIITQLNRGISVDYVTNPGAGGQVLQLFEAARKPAPPIPINEKKGESAMDEAEVKKLQESVRKSNQRLALFEARDVASKKIATFRLPEATKTRLVERVVAMAPISIDGELDAKAFETLVEAEVKDEAAYLAKLTEGRVVTGLGAEPAAPTAEQIKATEAEIAAELDESAENFGMVSKEAKAIFNKGRRAFRSSYNSGAADGVGTEVGAMEL